MNCENVSRRFRVSDHPTIRYLRQLLRPASSYAQRNEDRVIMRLFNKVDRFIDIGAYNGITGSNTFLFALMGAKGLCFEPVAKTFNYLRKLYFLNSKIICTNVGISDSFSSYLIRADGELSTILETEDPVNRACLVDYINENAMSTKIIVKPLTYYQELYPEFHHIDLVSIDVEGHELNVVRSIDFERTHAKTIILESLGGKTTNYSSIEKIFVDNNLIPVLTNQLNTIFVHQDYLNWAEINRIPSLYKEFVTIKL